MVSFSTKVKEVQKGLFIGRSPPTNHALDLGSFIHPSIRTNFNPYSIFTYDFNLSDIGPFPLS